MKRAGCVVLCYHHISDSVIDGDLKRFYVTPENFKKQMEYLYLNNFTILQLDTLVDIFRAKKKLPKKSIVLTFDDGYKSILFEVNDILNHFGFKATVFIPTGKIDKRNDWDYGVEDDLELLNWDEIRSLSKGVFTFYPHSVNHKKLTKLDDDSMCYEILESKNTLENILGGKNMLFSYPFSDFNEKVKNTVINSGYVGACICSSEGGVNNEETDLYLLKRVEINYLDSLSGFKWKIFFNRYLKNKTSVQPGNFSKYKEK